MTHQNQEDQDSLAKLEAEVIACRACPRLVEWREKMAREKRRAYRDWEYWGKPVPGFGDPQASLFIVGLAPGAHGSNRTGRVFTGDASGDTLFGALHRVGLANQPIARQRGDGLELYDTFITAVGRCAPPGNKPTAQELTNCRPFLNREFMLLPRLKVVLALGQIAYNGCIKLMRSQGYEVPGQKFGHALHLTLSSPELPTRHLLTCYHPSRQNTQTGRLTQPMIDQVFELAKSLIS